jgi:hypothetical protein
VARRKSYGDGLVREAIRDVECPECGVPAGAVCDRSRDPYSAAERSRLEAEGTSHYKRMLAAYGVPESKWDEYVARNQAGSVMGSARSARDIATGEVNCPVHAAAVRGTPCPRDGACPARVRKAAASAVQRQRRAERRKGAVRGGQLSWSDAVAELDCPLHEWAVRGKDCGPYCGARWDAYLKLRAVSREHEQEEAPGRASSPPRAPSPGPGARGARASGRQSGRA